MTDNKPDLNIDFANLRDNMGQTISKTFEELIIAGVNQILRTSNAYSRFTVDATYLYVSNRKDGSDFGLLYKVVEDGETKVYDSRQLRTAVNNGDVISRVDRVSGRTSTSEKELWAKFEKSGETPEPKKAVVDGAFGMMVQAITPKDSPRPRIEINEEREKSLYEFISSDIHQDLLQVFKNSYKAVPAEVFASFDANTEEIKMEMVIKLNEFNTQEFNTNDPERMQSVLSQWSKCIILGDDRYTAEGEYRAPEEFTEKAQSSLEIGL